MPGTRQWDIIPFNPLHHTGGDTFIGLYKSGFNSLSIHSTTQVETVIQTRTIPMTGLSIHSTTQVETLKMAKTNIIVPLSIHSTTQVETDFENIQCYYHILSIHSTTQVETFQRQHFYPPHCSFNPLHHTGGDQLSMLP